MNLKSSNRKKLNQQQASLSAKKQKIVEAPVLGKNRRSPMKSFEGIYVLVIQVEEDIEAKVGALGRKTFTKGFYAYVGSVQTNMGQRIKRHLASKKRRFWHIDYLLDNPKTKIIKVLFKEGDKTEECKTASYLSEKGELIASFGCSDCKCKSHLFHVENFRFLLGTMRVFSIET